MSDTTQTPVAKGSLAKTPFAHLVLYLYQRRVSGTLLATVPGEQEPIKVLFHRGRAVAAHLPSATLSLEQGLTPLAAARSGEFEFHESDLVGSGPGIVTGMFDPFTFVADCTRRFARDEIVNDVLARYRDQPLLLDPSMDLTRLSLTADEARFASPLHRGPATLEALCAQSILPPSAARRLLYTLLITRVVTPQQPSNPERESQPTQADSVQRGSAPGRASRGLTERLRPSGDAWRAIANRAAQISGPIGEAARRSPRPREPSQPLAAKRSSQPGVRPSISRTVEAPLTVQQGEGARGDESRPLRKPISRPITPAPGNMAGGRPVSRPISRPLTPSPYGDSNAPRDSRVGSSPAGRATPRPSLPDVSTLDAAGKIKRVELLCQRNQHEEALPIARALVEEDRKNPKYLGLLSHVLLGRLTGNDTIGKDIIDAVNQALRIDPDEVFALYTKARCYKRLGKEREALHYFKRTVAVEPNHLDAAREVRLLVLRMSEKRKR
jgi:tetratricopeptide (TPR) repeat protein